MNMWAKIKICGIIQIRGGVFMSDKAKTVCFTGHREIKDIETYTFLKKMQTRL